MSLSTYRRRRRMRTAAALACLISLGTAPALAAPATEDAPEPGISAVDGRVFSAADGYASEQAEVNASGNSRAVTRYTKGTSWAATNHYLLVAYTGEAQAYGNVFSSTQRVISASFKYSRNGSNVIGWQTSHAAQSGCSWSAGTKARKSITDSLGLNDKVTKFHYDFGTVHPSVC